MFGNKIIVIVTDKRNISLPRVTYNGVTPRASDRLGSSLTSDPGESPQPRIGSELNINPRRMTMTKDSPHSSSSNIGHETCYRTRVI